MRVLCIGGCRDGERIEVAGDREHYRLYKPIVVPPAPAGRYAPTTEMVEFSADPYRHMRWVGFRGHPIDLLIYDAITDDAVIDWLVANYHPQKG